MENGLLKTVKKKFSLNTNKKLSNVNKTMGVASLSLSLMEMVFCYQNCSDLLWEKIVLVIDKNFWILRMMAENLQNVWDH